MMTGRLFRALALFVPLSVSGAFAESSAASAPGRLMFTAPIANGAASGPSVGLSLHFDLGVSALAVTLNGRDIFPSLNKAPCTKSGCVASATLTPKDGLVAGKNILRAVANGGGGAVSKKLRFLWQSGTAALGTVPLMPPPAMNLATSYGQTGTAPWVTIGNMPPLPVYGANSNTPSSACTTPLQLLVLDRAQLTQISYQCFNAASDLSAALGAVTASQIAIVGTPYNNSVPAGLDTSAIGGTNYSQVPAAMYPQGYIAIGVGGAQAGQATENYWVPASATSPVPWAPFLEGLLVEDGAYYDFHPSDLRPFVVDPAATNPNTGMVGPAVTVDGVVYTPPQGTANGLWVLVFDRINGQPIDGSTDSTGPCQYASATATTCGQVFATNPMNFSQIGPLATYLGTLTNRNLVFITSVGRPFQGPIDAGAQKAIIALGGSEYDAAAIAGDTSPTAAGDTFTLVSIPGEPGYNSSINGKAIVSTTVNAASGQTGRVTGVLVRGLKYMFSPTLWAQQPAAAAAKGLGINYDYVQLAFQQITPWPLSDTPSRLAAYHYISSQIAPLGAIAPGLYDYRSYYTGGQLFTIVTNPSDPTGVAYVASFDDPVLGQTVAIAQDDFTAVAQQLKTEQADLRVVYSQFQGSGDASFSSLFNADGVVPLALIGAASAVQASQLTVNPGTTGEINVSNLLNITAGVTSIVAFWSPPFAVVSGLLWVASGLAADNPFGTGGTSLSTIPNPDASYLTTISQLANNNVQLQVGLSTAFAESLDNIYSDWGKLSSAAQHVTSDWLVPNQTSLQPIKAAMLQAATTSFYFQLMPYYYKLDTYPSNLSGNPSDFSWWTPMTYIPPKCYYVYRDYPPPAGAVASFNNALTLYYTFHSTPFVDTFVVSSGIYGMYQGEPTVSYPANEAAILNTLFNTLGVPPRELFSANGPFTRNLYGPGPQAGYGFALNCYLP